MTQRVPRRERRAKQLRTRAGIQLALDHAGPCEVVVVRGRPGDVLVVGKPIDVPPYARLELHDLTIQADAGWPNPMNPEPPADTKADLFNFIPKGPCR